MTESKVMTPLTEISKEYYEEQKKPIQLTTQFGLKSRNMAKDIKTLSQNS